MTNLFSLVLTWQLTTSVGVTVGARKKCFLLLFCFTISDHAGIVIKCVLNNAFSFTFAFAGYWREDNALLRDEGERGGALMLKPFLEAQRHTKCKHVLKLNPVLYLYVLKLNESSAKATGDVLTSNHSRAECRLLLLFRCTNCQCPSRILRVAILFIGRWLPLLPLHFVVFQLSALNFVS